jgi:hypothetical protein
MYKWLTYAVVVSDIEELEKGLRRSQVSALIKEKHPMGQQLRPMDEQLTDRERTKGILHKRYRTRRPFRFKRVSVRLFLTTTRRREC